jgi:hypothetical protein
MIQLEDVAIIKREQYVDERHKQIKCIAVMYKNKHGRHIEEFPDVSIDEVKQIYADWNNSLRKGESKRTPIKFFKLELAYKLTRID